MESSSFAMKSLFSSGFVEPLESRIAPATIVYQAGDAGSRLGEIDYTDPDSAAEDAVFVDTEDDPSDPISAVVGPGVVGVKDTFYVKLTTNTLLKVFNNTGFQPLISGDVAGNAGIGGTLIAFFVDKNLDNEVQLNELTGIALGKNVKAIISGSVDGDVVSNYNDALGRLGGGSEPVAQAQSLLGNPIANVVISGDVNGSFVSGGQINNLRVSGKIEQVLTGTAADGYAYDFNGAVADGGDQLVVATPAAGVKGISILNTTVGELDTMRAGNGGAGAVGGGLTNVTVLADENGFTLRSGDGGAGVAGKTSGGAGGAVNRVVVNGLDAGDVDDTPNALITIESGRGGDSLAGSTGKGGAGGLIQNVFVGFEEVPGSKTPLRSLTSLNDEVVLQAGMGGAGRIGGAGGVIKANSIFASPEGLDSDIQVLGGDGGQTNVASTSAKAGVGGSVSDIFVLNPANSAAAHDSKIIVHAGDGGLTPAGGSGNLGGSINGATLIGFQYDLHAGDGSAGQKRGGIGGSLSSILLERGAEGVRPEIVRIDAGSGGAASAGIGGNGGNLTGLTVRDSDLELLAINQTAGAANGGASAIGRGSLGGSVSKLDVTETDTGNAGVALIRSGDGGSGSGGGSAGSITTATIRAVQLDLNAAAGAGGNATVKGGGGKGGVISGFSFFSFNQAGGTEVSASVAAGAGGDGAGTGAGGAGGEVKNSNIQVGQAVRLQLGTTETALVDGGPITISGGNGGSSPGGAAGAGGAITRSTFISFAGDASLVAGDAGAGVKAGAGGRIDGVSIDVGQNVTLASGDGGGGGAGGNIAEVGYSRAIEDVDLIGTVVAAAGPAPLGAISVIAGNGSGAGKAAGNGGAIVNLSGFVGLSGMTEIIAGTGGAVATKAAAGGNVSGVSLFGGGGAGVEVRIQAGNASNAASAKTGGTGGSVVDVGLGVNPFNVLDPTDPDNAFALDPGTLIRHIAAGNGGDTGLASGRGGKGGDVKMVNAHEDIGVRSGEGFGFDTMGGIFAGAGGINTTVPHTATTRDVKDGAAGSVLQVTADAIASIVAGRPQTGDILTLRNLATKVDDIILNGLNNPARVDATGAYTNFDTANLIGGVVNPTEAGSAYPAAHPHANTFDEALGEFIDNDGNDEFSLGDTITADTDGFIAALSYINNLANVRPEALMTSIAGVITFIDLNNLNGQALQA